MNKILSILTLAYSPLESADNIWNTGKLHLPVKPVYCHQVHNMYIITIYCYYQVWEGKNSQLNEEISDGEQKKMRKKVLQGWTQLIIDGKVKKKSSVEGGAFPWGL